ncbi:hypothetical protein DSM107010_47740 [Chroococcidiopsis cubana SAG 39.79]|uniref:Filamentous haemagglutinin FhaB/tRNA nuclease CdiA-like TPS domain-containing protein n=1 Tax=Chroococcidiopsis cubana SAG 39.79 TaxID=388085 RepID=A0AB37UEA8_9CYAN|nr:filamentous hemagglutinin N-terminal domain-containing protein [Chroococcidiopsis cubana]RUT08629.1 hypothetical protein DSM107010_47740 [Chroococcidiopsis cubana SAG 39.79]
MLVVWGNGAIAISPDFRALFCYGDYFIVIGGLASVIGINLNIYIAEMYLQISSVSGRWCVRLGLACAIVGSAIAFGSTALAQVPPDSQIVPDSSLGADNSIVNSNPNGLDTISGGATRGSNLFHSFDRFSIPDGRAALFNNGADIQNILTRVTGGSVSNIDGILAARGAANLFLLNPNGIIFGENASLRVGGSFIATTASSINFADGTQFSATPGTTGAPLLTVSVPLGLQFGAGAGEIVNRASTFGLQVGAGKTLGLIGGNVSLEGGYLTAAGGRIELGAVAAPGVVGINPDPSGVRFSFPTDLALGNISLIDDSLVDVAAGGGGSIAVNAADIVLDSSSLNAGILSGFGSEGAQAGDIELNATNSITLANAAQLRNSTNGQGNSGKIKIVAGGTVTFDGRDSSDQFPSGAFSRVNSGANGNSGGIDITASSLIVSDRAQIDSDAYGTGSSGNITIEVQNVSLFNSTISSDVIGSGVGNGGDINIKTGTLLLDEGSIGARTYGDGDAGSIDINARQLRLSGGAQISASTFSSGKAGNLLVTGADLIEVIGTDVEGDSSGLFAQVNSGASGAGGNLTIETKQLKLSEGAQISVSTFSSGKAGSLLVTGADLIEAIGTSAQGNPSGLFAEVNPEASGDGGNLTIETKQLKVSEGARISASTSGSGQAGNLFVTGADLVEVIGTDAEGSPSGLFAQVNSEASGDGGNLTVEAKQLKLSAGAQISASTSGSGKAGNLFVTEADLIEAIGTDAEGSPSGLFAQVNSGAIGDGGNLTVEAKQLKLSEGAQISVSTFSSGKAGSLRITGADLVELIGTDAEGDPSGLFAEVNPRASGAGGDLTIETKQLKLSGGAQVSVSTFGSGKAGNLLVAGADLVELIGTAEGFSGGLFARARASGDGGNLTVETKQLKLSQGARISASTFGSGKAGNLRVTGADLVELIGTDAQGDPSGLFTQVDSDASGDGGNLTIETKQLKLSGGAQISVSTFGSGKAGNLLVTGADLVELIGADAEGDASGLFAQVDSKASGDGGNLTIATKQLNIRDGARVSVSSFGSGTAGNLDVSARNLLLDNGSLEATTTTGDRGNINVQSRSVGMRRGSRITTNASGDASGGNIDIDTRFLIAAPNEDNDIIANAVRGTAGNIDITTQGIFGIQARRQPTPETNDITANSELGIDGTVQLNSPEVDPSRDIVELPTGLVDASSLVAAGCPSGAENRFTVAGRGGLPPAPGDKLSSDALLTDWATLQTPETQNSAAVETTLPVATNTTPKPPVETITEATSWQYDRNGAIILTSGDTTSPSHLKTTPTSCPSS